MSHKIYIYFCARFPKSKLVKSVDNAYMHYLMNACKHKVSWVLTGAYKYLQIEFAE